MDGIIIINKTKGCTSHDIVYKIKKMLNEKVGHTGTLDPMAEGVLPILIGKGTLLSKYLINHDKKYIVELQLGKKTDTADSEGKIIEEQQVKESLLTNENITNILDTFIGKQEQVPPIYSAIKVNGKKLYEYARKGVEVEIPKREIEIYNIELLDINEKDKTIEFRVHCSKGTYIRTLCENIAEKLGTIGYMKELNRVQVGQFNLNQAITVEELEKNKENEKFLNQHLITVQNFFEKYPIVELKEEKLKLFLNGVQLTNNNDDGLYQIKVNNVVVGIGTIKNKLLKREIIY